MVSGGAGGVEASLSYLCSMDVVDVVDAVARMLPTTNGGLVDVVP